MLSHALLIVLHMCARSELDVLYRGLVYFVFAWVFGVVAATVTRWFVNGPRLRSELRFWKLRVVSREAGELPKVGRMPPRSHPCWPPDLSSAPVNKNSHVDSN